VWHSKFVNKNNCPLIIDGCSNIEVIVNNFADYFYNNCDVNTYSRNTDFKDAFSSRFKNHTGDSNYDNDVISVCVSLLDEIVTKLKTGKAAGIDCLTVNSRTFEVQSSNIDKHFEHAF
jgi:hypothetical protein